MGTYNYINGNVYNGEWLQDLKHGQGKLKIKSTGTDINNKKGEIYEGWWKNGEKHGCGEQLYSNSTLIF